MSKWLLGFLALIVSGALVVPDAEARRFGGARSLGAQRNVTPPAKPAQQQAAPAKQAQPAAPAAGSKWGPVLGGLALGGLLGYLFAGNGLGGLLLVALLATGAVMLFRALARRSAQGPVQFAGMREHASLPLQSGGAAASSEMRTLPADFDRAGFLRAAKRNFLKLQLAHDTGALEEIREFTTDEMFEAVKGDVGARGAEQTEVTELEAQLLELATENGAHWASVHFSGKVRDAGPGAPEPFEEVWNLVKPVDGSSGWLLAGIQQMH